MGGVVRGRDLEHSRNSLALSSACPPIAGILLMVTMVIRTLPPSHDALNESLQPPCEVGPVVTRSVQMRRLRPRGSGHLPTSKQLASWEDGRAGIQTQAAGPSSPCLPRFGELAPWESGFRVFCLLGWCSRQGPSQCVWNKFLFCPQYTHTLSSSFYFIHRTPRAASVV